MKQLLFILVLLFSFNAICEENWAPISENEKSTTYIDETSIVKVGKHSYFFWELVSYDEIRQVVTLPLEYPTFKESSRITLWEINCKEWFYYPVVEYSFSELMGKGIKIDTTRFKVGDVNIINTELEFSIEDYIANFKIPKKKLTIVDTVI